jgi:hypothetical protein
VQLPGKNGGSAARRHVWRAVAWEERWLGGKDAWLACSCLGRTMARREGRMVGVHLAWKDGGQVLTYVFSRPGNFLYTTYIAREKA